MAERADEVIWTRVETVPIGRPAERSRAEITAAAVALADGDGLDAVSMRRVATSLGTGPASLYRYVAARDELIDLMVDAVAAEYDLTPPTGDWSADLVGFARQTRTIMSRHPWLVPLVAGRPALGPHSLDLVEHVLDVLADHPAPVGTKLQAFAMLNGIVALFQQHEHAGAGRDGRTTAQWQAAQTAYLHHVAAQGRHPRLAQALTRVPAATAAPDDQLDTMIARIMEGILGPVTPPGSDPATRYPADARPGTGRPGPNATH